MYTIKLQICALSKFSRVQIYIYIYAHKVWIQIRERSGSVLECLTQDQGAAGSSLTGVTVLCPCARHINPYLVLVQPRKTLPYISERLFLGRRESNQAKSGSILNCVYALSRCLENAQTIEHMQFCAGSMFCTFFMAESK